MRINWSTLSVSSPHCVGNKWYDREIGFPQNPLTVCNLYFHCFQPFILSLIHYLVLLVFPHVSLFLYANLHFNFLLSLFRLLSFRFHFRFFDFTAWLMIFLSLCDKDEMFAFKKHLNTLCILNQWNGSQFLWIDRKHAKTVSFIH